MTDTPQKITAKRGPYFFENLGDRDEDFCPAYMGVGEMALLLKSTGRNALTDRVANALEESMTIAVLQQAQPMLAFLEVLEDKVRGSKQRSGRMRQITLSDREIQEFYRVLCAARPALTKGNLRT